MFTTALPLSLPLDASVVPPRVILLPANLVVANRQGFKTRVVDAILDGHPNIVLDASECGFIDAAGLGVLVSLSKKCRDAGGSMLVVSVGEDLRALFEISKLDLVINVQGATDG